MFYSDHEPPRLHVRYGNAHAVISIESLGALTGQLPPRALGLVTEWAVVHQEELREDWELASRQAPLKKIAPLE